MCVCVLVLPWPDSPLDKYGAILIASETLTGRDAVVDAQLQLIAAIDALAGIHWTNRDRYRYR